MFISTNEFEQNKISKQLERAKKNLAKAVTALDSALERYTAMCKASDGRDANEYRCLLASRTVEARFNDWTSAMHQVRDTEARDELSKNPKKEVYGDIRDEF